MIDLDEVTSVDEVEQFLLETAARINDGEQLTEDEQVDYLNAASLMMVVALESRGMPFDTALDVVENLVYGAEGEDSPEVTISVSVSEGKFSCSIARTKESQ